MAPQGQFDGSAAAKNLIGAQVTEVGFVLREHGHDIELLTDNKMSFAAVSDFPYGEWIFSAWDPGDKRRIPLFDVEGPVS